MKFVFPRFWGRPQRTALLGAVILVAVGTWALRLQAQQARDTERKLDLEDLESGLLRVLTQTGTLPPLGETSWCGVISAPANRAVREDIEHALRETQKYAKPAKPFPTDPRFGGTDLDYAYWKTSPVSFELLAELEADNNNSRPLDLERCELIDRQAGPQAPRSPVKREAPRGEVEYDYAIRSLQRTPL